MERAPHDELKVSWLAGNLDVAFRMTSNQALHGERMASWRVQGALLFFVLHKTLGTTPKTEIGLASNEKCFTIFFGPWHQPEIARAPGPRERKECSRNRNCQGHRPNTAQERAAITRDRHANINIFVHGKRKLFCFVKSCEIL